jgi:hypothetical protein
MVRQHSSSDFQSVSRLDVECVVARSRTHNEFMEKGVNVVSVLGPLQRASCFGSASLEMPNQLLQLRPQDRSEPFGLSYHSDEMRDF